MEPVVEYRGVARWLAALLWLVIGVALVAMVGAGVWILTTDPTSGLLWALLPGLGWAAAMASILTWADAGARADADALELIGPFGWCRRRIPWAELDAVGLVEEDGEHILLVMGRYPALGRRRRLWMDDTDPEVFRVHGVRTDAVEWRRFQRALKRYGRGVWQSAIERR
jgi:hypothetical protein